MSRYTYGFVKRDDVFRSADQRRPRFVSQDVHDRLHLAAHVCNRCQTRRLQRHTSQNYSYFVFATGSRLLRYPFRTP